MYSQPPLDPNHQEKRGTLNGLGVVLMVVGIPCAIGGVLSFLSVFLTPTSQFFADPTGTMDSNSRHAVFGMIAMVVGVGLSTTGARMLRFANVGKITRYQAGEIVPVVKDIASEVSPLMGQVTRELAGAVRDGLRGTGESLGQSHGIAHRCGAVNHPGDAFLQRLRRTTVRQVPATRCNQRCRRAFLPQMRTPAHGMSVLQRMCPGPASGFDSRAFEGLFYGAIR
jgi:hypothetical protein